MIASRTLRLSPLPLSIAQCICSRLVAGHDHDVWNMSPVDIRLQPCRRQPYHRLPSYATSIIREKTARPRFDEEQDVDATATAAASVAANAVQPRERYYMTPMKHTAVQLWLTFATDDDAMRVRQSLHLIGVYTKRMLDNVCFTHCTAITLSISRHSFIYLVHRRSIMISSDKVLWL